MRYICGVGLGFRLCVQATSICCEYGVCVRGDRLYVVSLIVWESEVFS